MKATKEKFENRFHKHMNYVVKHIDEVGGWKYAVENVWLALCEDFELNWKENEYEDLFDELVENYEFY